jgi:predicted dehydrogenase
MTSEMTQILRVGIIGCGEVAQVIHIPTLTNLPDLFTVSYLYDISPAAMKHCQSRVLADGPPRLAKNVDELVSSPEVDIVFVLSADEYHAEYAVKALKHNKNVFVEKPMALTNRDADLIIQAERKSQGRVCVGYMRRHAAAFVDALREVGGLSEIVYARVRDIIGPNSTFVGQSGVHSIKFGDDIPEEDRLELERRSTEIVAQALENEVQVPVTKDNINMWRLLGNLGSHDLSAMREILGMPRKVLGAKIGTPFWSALFDYGKFAVIYESGVDQISRFDAHIEVYSNTKSVRVVYDTPYVRGLPVTLVIRENLEGDPGAYQERTIRRTYEDPYTLQAKTLYSDIINDVPHKTSAADARLDLEIYRQILAAAN